jgi:hypothetical protein
MQAKQRLYLTKDRKALVGEGDKRAASLYAVPGDEIPESAVKAFGLVDGQLKSAAKKDSSETKEQKAPSANKEAGAGQDKADA